MLANILFFIAEEAAPQPSAAGGLPSLILMIGLLFVVMYFFMIRPQSKKQKALNNMRNELRRNDKVLTTGGLIGIVSKIKDNEVLLKIDENNNTRIWVVKAAIVHVLEKFGAEEKDAEDEDKNEDKKE